MAPQVGRSVFQMPEVGPTGISLVEVDRIIHDLKQGREDAIQNFEATARSLPNDQQAAFRKSMDAEIRGIEEDLRAIIALRSSFSGIRYQIDDLTGKFNGLCKTYYTRLENLKTNRQDVQKSNQVFSATFQQAKFSFPSSFGSKNSPEGQPATRPTSPDKGKLVEAKIHWEYYAKSLPEDKQERCLKKVDDRMANLKNRREFLANAGVKPERSAELLAKDIKRIDFDLKQEYPLPSETE